ncbi:MAG TPA: hypothetical protein VN740_00515 [Solirubrobacteraceae bacterium]|nr:hypothetical protein [Solirubrobacteraceae bacterium]
MSPPTYEDAQLMLQLAQWGTALGVEDAMPHVFADSFDPQSADAMADPAVRKLLSFCESIGTLTKHGLLNAQLVNDWLWIDGLWARLGPAALRLRERHGEPRLYENFEALASP